MEFLEEFGGKFLDRVLFGPSEQIVAQTGQERVAVRDVLDRSQIVFVGPEYFIQTVPIDFFGFILWWLQKGLLIVVVVVVVVGVRQELLQFLTKACHTGMSLQQLFHVFVGFLKEW